MAIAKKDAFGVIEGTLVYAKIAQHDKKYKSEDFEYSIAVIVDEDAADTWDEQFPKQPAKKIKVAEFETKYRFPCPIEGVKNVYEIKLKKDSTKDGEPFYPEYRPRVFLDDNEGGRTDITESRLIANGSEGKISYRISTNEFGTFAKLQNVLIEEDNFKEYTPTGGAAGSEFGDKPLKKEEARKEVTQGRPEKSVAKEEAKETKTTSKTSTKKAKPPVDEDDEPESPF